MPIGGCRQAEAGHYYRRRRSSSGNWYTEQKSAYEIKRIRETAVEAAAQSAERIQLQETRKEPGYWPKKENPSIVEWQEKDPTYRNWDWFGNAFLIVFIGIPTAIGVGMGIFTMAYILWPLLLIMAVCFFIGKLREKF